MGGDLSGRVHMLRQQRGWSQEHLARLADVDSRTIQRIEAGGCNPGPETLQGLAGAFDLDVSKLLFGFSAENLADFEEQFLCPHCGAPLETRTFVDHEYGDVECEEFRCGYTRGWRDRPCPKDPRFPEFEDYELTFEEEDGGWCCWARGRTDAAHSVELSNGFGRSREEAERFVRRSYIQARDGSEAAEILFPLFG